MRGNFASSEFDIFDNGFKQDEIKVGSLLEIRRQLGLIVYSSDKIGKKNPRKIDCYLPMVDRNIYSNLEGYKKICSW
jgi:hypothetical protein